MNNSIKMVKMFVQKMTVSIQYLTAHRHFLHKELGIKNIEDLVSFSLNSEKVKKLSSLREIVLVEGLGMWRDISQDEADTWLEKYNRDEGLGI